MQSGRLGNDTERLVVHLDTFDFVLRTQLAQREREGADVEVQRERGAITSRLRFLGIFWINVLVAFLLFPHVNCRLRVVNAVKEFIKLLIFICLRRLSCSLVVRVIYSSVVFPELRLCGLGATEPVPDGLEPTSFCTINIRIGLDFLELGLFYGNDHFFCPIVQLILAGKRHDMPKDLRRIRLHLSKVTLSLHIIHIGSIKLAYGRLENLLTFQLRLILHLEGQERTFFVPNAAHNAGTCKLPPIACIKARAHAATAKVH